MVFRGNTGATVAQWLPQKIISGAIGVARVSLTERFVNSDRRVPEGGRVDYPDAIVPGLALRVSSNGHKSYVFIARFPLNPKNPTRRVIAEVGRITLEQARQLARDWQELIIRGVDPKTEEARGRAQVERQKVNTFGMVANAFLERHGSKLAKVADMRKSLLIDFGSRWADRPVVDIRAEEVAAAVREIVGRGSPYQAHNALGYLRRMYNWAIGTHEFGVEMSPVERLRPKDLIGKREVRERVLTDAELRAVWEGAAHMGYPYGPLIRLLILTGQREREIADMSWPEIDTNTALLTVPARRMKGDRLHAVPLCGDAMALLDALPFFNSGPFVFTTTSGEKPVNGFSKAKNRIDAICGVTGWKFHDLRRTVRTHFSALPVQDIVRELVIAHAKPGLHKVYDQHAYLAEKRECLDLWEARLRSILSAEKTYRIAT